MSSSIEVLNPVAISQGELNRVSLALRPESLVGKKIGLLWNSKRGGDVALARVGELLKGRFRDVQVTRIDGAIRCQPETLERAKKEFEVVVGATGD